MIFFLVENKGIFLPSTAVWSLEQIMGFIQYYKYNQLVICITVLIKLLRIAAIFAVETALSPLTFILYPSEESWTESLHKMNTCLPCPSLVTILRLLLRNRAGSLIQELCMYYWFPKGFVNFNRDKGTFSITFGPMETHIKYFLASPLAVICNSPI